MNDVQVCKKPQLPCFYKNNYYQNHKARPRMYLQFNELVFNGLSTVDTASLSGDYKLNNVKYPFKHGVYTGGTFRNGRLLMDAQDLSLDLKLPFRTLSRVQALNYNTFIHYNLSRQGKLWALDTGGKLLWAYAIPKHPPYSEYKLSTDGFIEFTCDFLLPEGVWHVADTSSIFLLPYDQCDFEYSLMTQHTCGSQLERIDNTCETCQECESLLCEEMHYCNTCWNPYDPCNSEYQIVEHSGLARKWFKHETWGLSFAPKQGFLAGFYKSETIYDAPTQVVAIGQYKNPYIQINNTRINIKGEYDGTLFVNFDGTVTYLEKEYTFVTDKAPLQLNWEDIEYSTGSLTLMTQHGRNGFRIYNQIPHSDFNRAYVKIDELTG